MIRQLELGPKAPGEFRIAHLSDLHISADRSGLRSRWRSWVGKSQAKNLVNLQTVLSDLAAQDIDHIVITGDLTNGAKEEEFDALKQALGDWLQSDRLTVLPGNHDLSYRRVRPGMALHECPRKLWHFVSHFPGLFPSHYPPEMRHAKKQLFPFVKSLDGGHIALIVIDTTGHLTTKAGPFNSFGQVGLAQLAELRAILKNPWLHNCIKIVAMHHHPMIVPIATMFDSFKYLFQSKQLLDLLYESRIELVIHGHKHHPFCWQSHTFRGHDMIVICAGPPDAYAGAKSSDLVYNIYSIVGHRIAIHYRTCPASQRPKTEFSHIHASKPER
ncbi:MAG: metallophosphoesterase [Candidatus Sumerlaeia bacterium]|nr:metallophosphoesterase [Candidatus Sumerlaeia bacterium]